MEVEVGLLPKRKRAEADPTPSGGAVVAADDAPPPPKKKGGGGTRDRPGPKSSKLKDVGGGCSSRHSSGVRHDVATVAGRQKHHSLAEWCHVPGLRLYPGSRLGIRGLAPPPEGVSFLSRAGFMGGVWPLFRRPGCESGGVLDAPPVPNAGGADGKLGYHPEVDVARDRATSEDEGVVVSSCLPF